MSEYRMNIGRVLPKWRGVWNAATEYYKMDYVMFDKSGYLCVKDNKTVLPGSDDETWKLLVQGGDKGDKGDTGTPGACIPRFTGTYDDEHVYSYFDVVEYDGDSYVCLEEGTCSTPPSSMDTYQVWRRISKGVDYDISESGEVSFKKHGDITGIRTYMDNVYDRRDGMTLEEKLDIILYNQNYIINLLKYTDIWSDGIDFRQELMEKLEKIGK